MTDPQAPAPRYCTNTFVDSYGVTVQCVHPNAWHESDGCGGEVDCTMDERDFECKHHCECKQFKPQESEPTQQ
jgi:hypothetical protein